MIVLFTTLIPFLVCSVVNALIIRYFSRKSYKQGYQAGKSSSYQVAQHNSQHYELLLSELRKYK